MNPQVEKAAMVVGVDWEEQENAKTTTDEKSEQELEAVGGIKTMARLYNPGWSTPASPASPASQPASQLGGKVS